VLDDTLFSLTVPCTILLKLIAQEESDLFLNEPNFFRIYQVSCSY